MLANIGLLHMSSRDFVATAAGRRESAQLALPWWERAVAAYERVLGPAHPSSRRSRNELARVLRDGLGKHRDAAAVEAAAGGAGLDG